VEGIDTSAVLHVGIVVHSLDTAVNAWEEFLGVGPASVGVTSTSEDEYNGTSTSAGLKQAIFDVGAFKIELMEPVDGPSIWASDLNARGEGLHHIAFRVHSMDDGIGSCEVLGMPLIQRGEFEKGRYAYLGSEGAGTVIELLEFDPGHAEFVPESDGDAGA